MRPIGFSTGSINPRDPGEAIDRILDLSADAVELSALRLSELEDVVRIARNRNLEEFAWVSIHAPSRIPVGDEAQVVELLKEGSGDKYPIVVHPDTMHDLDLWRIFGERLFVENMDRRKSFGRFAHEFVGIFERLPRAQLCLDVAHARQIDATMVEAYEFVRMLTPRLREIHISEVSAASKHSHISIHAHSLLADFLGLLPRHTPVIIESVLDRMSPQRELEAVRHLFVHAHSRIHGSGAWSQA